MCCFSWWIFVFWVCRVCLVCFSIVVVFSSGMICILFLC